MEKKEKKDFSRPLLRVFLGYFGPHKGLFFLDLFCALTASLIDLSFPLVARKAMHDMLPGREYEIFFRVMVIVAVAFLLRAALNYVITYWGHMFGVRVEADLREDLFTHIQSLDFSFFDKNRTGQLLSRMTGDLFEITEMSHHGPEDLFIAAVTIIGAVIVMFTIQWKLALVILIIIPVALFIVMLNRRRMIRTSGRVKSRLAEINGEIESGISGIRTSKAFANEKADYDKFAAANESFKTSKCDSYKAFGMFNSSLEFFMCIMPVVIMAFGGWLIMRDDMNYADLITFYLYISTFITPIRKLANFMETFMNGWAGLTRFVDIMRTEPEIRDRENALPLENVRGDISIENLWFAYENDSIDVISGINLDIRAGETVAIVGPSGGGKSTLCQLIPRFYDADEGVIRIDGRDIRDYTLESLRKNIGIVQQDVFLFPDTLKENIRYGNPSATDEEVAEAAAKAEIYDDITAMPEGFDSYAGERGVLLSGGQKQRVSIARIFLKNPPILILDEATSALDTVTESRIQGAFDKLAEGRTTLIIAHRLSTIRNADRIVLIDEGVIKEEGTHSELMARDGMYAQLYRLSERNGGACADG
ncbi:MAG: ABC transporter ATP-binding protein/permease [Clostridiales bacterium]|nr:ABC transporter ATP-binding protein/permease [Clostridiales bacterium]MDD7035042.1 ABC transporter ATP-binding protein [Bacillota bacterium]MDY2920367.1 ABC transporter ATP-binding protein [Lentihominibacter sp.]